MWEEEPLRTGFICVSEKGQEGSRGASLPWHNAAGMDVPEEDPEMSAGQWETLGKDRGGEHWLVLILILREK